ncbi:MAG TPA: ATP-binding protein [Gaiellaceae bacterium]|nr:ATP-binding protein [Gaiellaceae bacterium]
MSTPANPFRYGAIARGEFFTDREGELQALIEDVRGGQDVVIISPRRLGKTSLVERAVEELRGEGALVAYLDLLGSPSKAELADDLAQAFHDGLLSPLGRTLERVREFFSNLVISPRVTLSDDGRPLFEFLGYEREEDADNLLEGLLALPGELAGDRRVVVVLDEFQEIVAIDPRLPGQVRAVFQRQPEVAHVYLGSKRHLMEPMFMDRAAPLYRAAKPMTLGPIAPERFVGFLRERFRIGNVEVADEALDHVLSLTAGRPYETQELCSFAWTLARLEEAAVDVDLVERALDDLLEAESARYVAVWDRLPANQRALLLSLAREAGRIYSEGYRRRHKLGPASTVQASLVALERLDLVEAQPGGGYALADIFLRRWLRRDDRH